MDSFISSIVNQENEVAGDTGGKCRMELLAFRDFDFQLANVCYVRIKAGSSDDAHDPAATAKLVNDEIIHTGGRWSHSSPDIWLQHCKYPYPWPLPEVVEH